MKSVLLGRIEILREFAKIIKEQVCGYVGEPSIQEDANYMLSKLELCTCKVTFC